MSQLEKILTAINIVLAVTTVPIWSYLLRIRDAVRKVDTLEESLIDNVDQLNKEFEKFKVEVRASIKELNNRQSAFKDRYKDDMFSLQKELGEDRMAVYELLGKINGTLVGLDGSVKSLNSLVQRSEEHFKSNMERLYKDMTEHKNHIERIITSK